MENVCPIKIETTIEPLAQVAVKKITSFLQVIEWETHQLNVIYL